MKFDIDMTVDEKSIQEMRRFVKLGDGEDLLVGGSTHRGEEEILLSVFGKLVREFPNLKLLIAPRHVERAEEVASLVRKHGFEPVKLSASNVRQAAPEARQIYILNMIGHLKDAYALGSLVYIGGSLVRHGGQNPIEPAIFEKPIIFGPHMFNFKNIARALLDDEGAIQIHCEKDLLETASALLKKRQRGEELGRNAKRSVLRNRGSTEENLKTIISSL
jgi:3-deoxy-D-manno-octulosonic-acid transferase